MDLEAARNAVFVSCDIVSHGDDPDHSRQLERIKSLNACIAETCGERFGRDLIWASGGDGGHLALFGDDKCGFGIKLVARLYAWANETTRGPDSESVGLRLTAHFGPASVIRGADGRHELVGDGINVCGSLLKFGRAGVALVTAPFRDLCESLRQNAGPVPETLCFHREQQVYLKHDRAAIIMPMSIEGVIPPPDANQIHPEKARIANAMKRGRFWAAIYHAKRLLQVDSSDAEAIGALQMLNPSQLVLRARSGDGFEAHPLLSALNRQSLQELIRAAQLVEREDGETICAQDDPGDAMFIVLKGGIGVAASPPPDAPATAAPLSIRFGEGQIVGELALALNRRRTATLQAIGPTAFLSINYDILRGLLESGPSGRLQRVFSDFLLERSLRFLCQSCTYLAKGPDAPLAGLSDPWETIAADAEQFKLNWEQASAKFGSEDRFAAPGVYILAGGALIESSQNEIVPKKLDAADLPIVCVNLPGTFVSSSHAFQIDPDAGAIVNVVRISDRSLRAFGPAVFARLVERLKQRLVAQFSFDVFISYSNRDEQIASAWRAALEQAGLRVYMGRPDAMRKFKKEIELALAESLVMVPFVSDRAAGPDGQKGWVQREIEYRRTLFDEDHCNILPIELTRGLAAVFADGFSALAVTGDGLNDIGAVVDAIRAVKEGAKAPPFATRLEAGLKL
ncbi:MAG: cyclic nucleotide-binding domain-containing protein [Hyphomonadaceae bacterium]|nr:cyclic nucleotide-binding domain-containing protein [Hyphomonadaceae bacterium]